MLESASPTELDPRTKIELLRKEQASIKAARIQRKQELAEQKKAASVSDSKVPKEEKAYSAAKELTDTAPGVNGLSKGERLHMFDFRSQNSLTHLCLKSSPAFYCRFWDVTRMHLLCN